MKFKTIGLLGLGNESTLFYIKELNAAYARKNEECITFPIKLLNTNFIEINNLLPKPSNQLDGIVQTYIDELVKLNAELILIPNITLHETVDRLKIGVPIIHPLHSTASEIKKKKHKKVVLFGSKYTMTSNYVKNIFEEHNIAISLPSNDDIELIDEIRKQVYQQTETKNLLDSFNLIVKKYAQNNAVVLACTELSLASINNNNKVFDMVRIQVDEAVKENRIYSN